MSDHDRTPEPEAELDAERSEPELSDSRLSDPDLQALSLPELSDEEEAELRSLIRGALVERDTAEAPDVLSGVQRKLRERSGGKFYADGWSTSQEPPIATYLVTSALMLVVLLAVYAVLGPLSGEAVQVPMEPAPVQVLPSPTPAPSQ